MEFNLALVNEAISARVPDREAIVRGEHRITYAELAERTRRLANVLIEHGFGVNAERVKLENWESGQDHLALYLHNGSEYIEGMLGAYKARAVPFNVNYRYVSDELVYLLNDARAKGIIFHSGFAQTLAEVAHRVPSLELFIQVEDGSGNELMSGAVWYEEALADSPTSMPEVEPSPDDLYMLYTGGTTGMPKGVLWRQADIFPTALGGRDIATGSEWDDMSAMLDNAETGVVRMMPCAPFMHGAAHWLALTALNCGNTVVLQTDTSAFEPVDIWTTVEAEGVGILLIVGDAFARPLIDELERGDYDLSSLIMLVSGGAALSDTVKRRLLDLIPTMAILDGLGSSETGQQANQIVGTGARICAGTFKPGPEMRIVCDDLATVITPDDTRIGWMAQAGRVPLGYLGDEERTGRTFTIIDGIRHVVPGDRASFTSDGMVLFRGRDSATINSGGEKVFAEEVERALASHPAVYDVVVTGRPSARWGAEVVAIVQVRDGEEVTPEALIAEAEGHLARFKLPKDILFVDRVARSPAGKADYRWARNLAQSSTKSSTNQIAN